MDKSLSLILGFLSGNNGGGVVLLSLDCGKVQENALYWKVSINTQEFILTLWMGSEKMKAQRTYIHTIDCRGTTMLIWNDNNNDDNKNSDFQIHKTMRLWLTNSWTTPGTANEQSTQRESGTQGG